jgi:branched chain amino acid efflux pump
VPRIVIAGIAASAAAHRTTHYRDGMRVALPLVPLPVVFGLSFGVLAEAAGMGVFAPTVMSATAFAGSAQFAAAAILDTAGGVLAAFGAAALLNARYVPISFTVAPSMGGSLAARVLEAQLIVDETWALAQEGGGRVNRRILVGAGVVFYVAWVAGTAAGALGAGYLGEPESFGLDAAFPALFLALLVRQLGSGRAVVAALLGAVIALALVPIASPGVPIIAAATACLVGARR